jgi:hypothetical protein
VTNGKLTTADLNKALESGDFLEANILFSTAYKKDNPPESRRVGMRPFSAVIALGSSRQMEVIHQYPACRLFPKAFQ